MLRTRTLVAALALAVGATLATGCSADGTGPTPASFDGGAKATAATTTGTTSSTSTDSTTSKKCETQGSDNRC
ncbi:MAG TPA: hypothetical protein VFL95_12365 [Gemmatimonadales bacterium]|nr:hypothetical protein [Gemmatimonadales bacterium]